MMNTPETSILPVICGADMEDYAMARLFHETFGVSSLILSEYLRGSVDNSKICQVRLQKKGTLADPAKLLQLLQGIAEEFPTKEPILLSNLDDILAAALVNRDKLEPRWFIPYADLETFEFANSKTKMAQLLSSLGLPVPGQTELSTAAEQKENKNLEQEISGLRPPFVVKPADGGLAVNRHCRQGLHKVTLCQDVQQVRQLFNRLVSNGVFIPMILQELIPGDDTTQWVVNGYVDRRGDLQAIGCGQVLLGIHEPSKIGNAGVVIVQDNPELIAEAKRIIAAVKLRGFFSLDVKIDPRDGQHYWFDLNPRPGRGFYYLKVGGINLAQAVNSDRLVTIKGQALQTSLQTLTNEGIFAVMPAFMVTSRCGGKRYLVDVNLRRKVRSMRSQVVSPLR